MLSPYKPVKKMVWK